LASSRILRGVHLNIEMKETDYVENVCSLSIPNFIINISKERRQLENELHTEILPGTEVMADVGSHHFVKGAHREVLVPQPSDDPNDPLNWSTMWKITCITSASMVRHSITESLCDAH
jgi:hypothetical protein